MMGEGATGNGARGRGCVVYPREAGPVNHDAARFATRLVTGSLFFSSRRRHTRLQGDWSSDVCSSDLFQRRLPSFDLAFSFWGGLLLCPIKYCAENAINKSAGSVTAKLFGEFHCFVNGGLSWYRIIEQNLVDCKSKDVFVNSGHLL